jgi:hypothetical protein
MRIAMVVDGTRGDVQPMLVLGAALVAEGHSVRICAPPDFRSAAVSAGLEFHAVGKDVRAYLTDHAEAIDGNARKAILEGLRYIRALQPPPGQPLPVKLESFLEQGPAPVYLGFGSMTDAIGLATIAQGHKVAYREAHGLLEELADAKLDGKTRCTSPA